MLSVGPFVGTLDAEAVRRYAPIAIVTQIWDAQEAARPQLVPAEVQRSASGGVHGEHDVVLHRPIVVGEPLRTWVELHGARPAGRNAVVTLRYDTRDAAGDLVAEQWWSTVYLGASCDVTGSPAPDHSFPDDARQRPVGVCEVDVDEDMARRYAEVSGDWSAHHFDVDAARRSGADRPFLHGLCTMALCAQAVVQVMAVEHVRRVAVRFAAPMPLGDRLTVRLYDAGSLGCAFEASCGDALVVTHGWAQVG